MAVTKSFKVYGMDDGATQHRQRESFNSSYVLDFSKDGNVRRIEVENADKTGTNEYSIVRITRNTEKECYDELNGQLSDGIFENSKTGRVEEIPSEKKKINIKDMIKDNAEKVTDINKNHELSMKPDKDRGAI